MRTEEYRTLVGLIRELAAEVRNVKTGLDSKIDHVAKKVTEAFQGFGILDPEEETWTEQQVCERYHVSRRTMYEYRKSPRFLTHFDVIGRRSHCLFTFVSNCFLLCASIAFSPLFSYLWEPLPQEHAAKIGENFLIQK